jgi:hypothetical protein
MKSIISKIFFISAAALLFGSCKKDEAQQIFAGGKAPVLSASVSGTIPLSFAVEDQLGVNFTWTNPNYQFGNGISSQDVTYAMEIDKTGNNFAGANKVTISIAITNSINVCTKNKNKVPICIKNTSIGNSIS